MGKRNHVNDFTVDTNSQCFICFKKVSRGFSSVKLKEAETHSSSSSVHSLQYLSRYLEMDMRKMFHEKGSIPQLLLAQVQKSRLKVELCEDCGQMNETFSRQYKQLEKIEMEVKSSIELMHRKFQEARETNKTAQFQNLNIDAIDFNGKMDIANALRTEAMGKCKLKIGRPCPLIKIQKMSIREVMSNQRRNKLNSQNPFSGPKTKQPEVAFRQPNQNDMEGNDYFDDSQVNLCTSDVDLDDVECHASVLEEPTTAKLQTSMQGIYSRGSLGGAQRDSDVSNAVDGKRYTINPETGKLKCNLCSMEFQKPCGFKYHYEGIHLGIKYKCNLCKKEYSQRPAYNLHHRKSHKGLPYSFSVVTVSEQEMRETVGSTFNSDTERRQCDLCSLEFESADNLQNHYSSAHPDIKYRCKLCFQEFGQFSFYQQHQCNATTKEIEQKYVVE